MNRETASGCGCIGWLMLLAFNLTIGAMSVSYLLGVWLQKDIPWWGDVLIGMIGAEISVPAAVITWLLHDFGAV